MTTVRTKKKDGELLAVAICSFLFTGFLIGFDVWYNSISEMHWASQLLVAIGHVVLAYATYIMYAKWKDPKYDKYRWVSFFLSLALAITIGVHHGVTKENKQVIIDSKENAAKP